MVDREKRDRVEKKMYEMELKSLNKYFNQQAYLMLDKKLAKHKKDIINSKQPAVALAYIKASQTPLVFYLEMCKKCRRSIQIEYPERLYENSDFDRFEKLICERGTYNQIKEMFNCSGTNVVRAGLNMYVAGHKENISYEQIIADLTESMKTRRMAETSLVDIVAYPDFKMLDYNIDKVKKQIEEAIIEYKANGLYSDNDKSNNAE